MNFIFAYKMAIKSIFGNKVRSGLTMLGVIIGVMAVIVAVGFAQGSMKSVTDQVEGMGSNMISVMLMDQSESKKFTVDDLNGLVKSSIFIDSAAPYVMGTVDIKYGKESKTTNLIGTTPDYSEIAGIKMGKGRNFSDVDIDNGEKVVVIGTAIEKKFFEGEESLGKDVKINGTKFRVVGVLESMANGAEKSSDDRIVIPINNAQRMLKMDSLTAFYVRAKDGETVDIAIQKTKDYLYNIYRDEDSYVVFSQEAMMSMLGSITDIMMVIFGGIATISLVVGGIGIMNIMLVSVTERTREIGIRKAIGAKKRDIMIQFLIESLILTGIGGIIGIILGILIIKYGIGAIGIIEPVYSVEWIMIAFTISCVIGVVFGLFPAKKAANLQPIEALRNE